VAKAKVYQIPAIQMRVSTLKDSGLSLGFHTQEASDEEKVAIMNFTQRFGYLQFSDSEIQEVPKGTLQRDSIGKSPSQRLRSVLYVLYQQSGVIELTFEEYYTRRMEQFIDRVKKQLD
jgi:hypothetical protein